MKDFIAPTIAAVVFLIVLCIPLSVIAIGGASMRKYRPVIRNQTEVQQLSKIQAEKYTIEDGILKEKS